MCAGPISVRIFEFSNSSFRQTFAFIFTTLDLYDCFVWLLYYGTRAHAIFATNCESHAIHSINVHRSLCVWHEITNTRAEKSANELNTAILFQACSWWLASFYFTHTHSFSLSLARNSLSDKAIYSRVSRGFSRTVDIFSLRQMQNKNERTKKKTKLWRKINWLLSLKWKKSEKK